MPSGQALLRTRHVRTWSAYSNQQKTTGMTSSYLPIIFTRPTPTGSSTDRSRPMFKHHVFARSGPLTLAGFANSGADWVDRFKPYIEDGKTIVVSPHKVFGPQTNDLVLQLRKR